MKQIINIKGKRIYFNYNDKGELIEVLIYDNEDIDINYSWLND